MTGVVFELVRGWRHRQVTLISKTLTSFDVFEFRLIERNGKKILGLLSLTSSGVRKQQTGFRQTQDVRSMMSHRLASIGPMFHYSWLTVLLITSALALLYVSQER